jgi:hypothetical protein
MHLLLLHRLLLLLLQIQAVLAGRHKLHYLPQSLLLLGHRQLLLLLQQQLWQQQTQPPC